MFADELRARDQSPPKIASSVWYFASSIEVLIYSAQNDKNTELCTALVMSEDKR